MRAALLVEPGKLEITDVEKSRSASDDQVVVEVRAAGVCGTDLHFLRGLIDPLGFPRILGHEIAGVVIEGASKLASGTRVAVYNVLYCGECGYCLSGRQRLCANTGGMLGFSVDGGFADYLTVPERNLVPLPESVSLESAAVLSCSGMSAVHAVRLSGIGLGDTVIVDGVGGVGLMLIQVAKAAGSRVVAVGDREHKLDLAADVGADESILIADADEYSRLREVLSGLGVVPNVYFETVGTAESMAAGYEALAPGGAFVQIGYTKDTLDVHPAVLIKNELRWITSAAGSLADLETAIQLAGSGSLQPSITRCGGLEELPRALTAIEERTVLGRSVITLGKR